jgi:hypothetical protein
MLVDHAPQAGGLRMARAVQVQRLDTRRHDRAGINPANVYSRQGYSIDSTDHNR